MSRLPKCHQSIPELFGQQLANRPMNSKLEAALERSLRIIKADNYEPGSMAEAVVNLAAEVGRLRLRGEQCECPHGWGIYDRCLSCNPKTEETDGEKNGN